MSLYWRKNPSRPDTILPQAIMRPFWHPVEISLDDQKFCIELKHDRLYIFSLLVLMLSLILFIIPLFFILNPLHDLQLSTIWNKQTLNSTLIFFAIFLLAGLLLFLFSQMIKPGVLHFDRKNRLISYPQRGLLAKYFESDYDKFQGKIEYTKNLFGKRKTSLLLENTENKHLILLCSTFNNPQDLVGYWSFIVQYMKKDAPLPEVSGLHIYPDKTPGVIHQKTIDYS